jgi:hypothetical protein
MRNIELHLSSEDMITIAEAIGTWDKLWEAIGYLSSWNLSFPQCRIFRDGGVDLVAVYSDADGNRQYTIGAVWHDDHYGFHS